MYALLFHPSLFWFILLGVLRATWYVPAGSRTHTIHKEPANIFIYIYMRQTKHAFLCDKNDCFLVGLKTKKIPPLPPPGFACEVRSVINSNSLKKEKKNKHSPHSFMSHTLPLRKHRACAPSPSPSQKASIDIRSSVTPHFSPSC